MVGPPLDKNVAVPSALSPAASVVNWNLVAASDVDRAGMGWKVPADPKWGDETATAARGWQLAVRLMFTE